MKIKIYVYIFPIIQEISVTWSLGSKFPIKGHAFSLFFFWFISSPHPPLSLSLSRVPALSFYLCLFVPLPQLKERHFSQQLLEPGGIEVSHKHCKSVIL